MKKYYRFSKLFLSLVWRRVGYSIPDRIRFLTAWEVSGMIWLDFPLKSPILSTNKDNKA